MISLPEFWIFKTMELRIACAVHGGAGALSDAGISAAKHGCSSAAEAGYRVLAAGGTAVDAVEAAVRVLEDDPHFNAGYGSVLTSAGTIEMDALIMNGLNLKAGAITSSDAVQNAITLARAVMERTPHVLLTGQATRTFAERITAEDPVLAAKMPVLKDVNVLITDARRRQLVATLANSQALAAGTRMPESATIAAPGAGEDTMTAAVKHAAAGAAALRPTPKPQADGPPANGAVHPKGFDGCEAEVDDGDRRHDDTPASGPSHQRVKLNSGMTDAADLTRPAAAAASAASRDDQELDRDPPCAGDHDTVGAVAIDMYGNVAAATSTGGLTGKWVGRVGDTPMIGAGGYADNVSGAVSTTGW